MTEYGQEKDMCKQMALIMFMHGLTYEEMEEKSKFLNIVSDGKIKNCLTALNAQTMIKEYQSGDKDKIPTCKSIHTLKGSMKAMLKKNCCFVCPLSKNYANAWLNEERAVLKYILTNYTKDDTWIPCEGSMFCSVLSVGRCNDVIRYPFVPFYKILFEKFKETFISHPQDFELDKVKDRIVVALKECLKGTGEKVIIDGDQIDSFVRTELETIKATPLLSRAEYVAAKKHLLNHEEYAPETVSRVTPVKELPRETVVGSAPKEPTPYLSNKKKKKRHRTGNHNDKSFKELLDDEDKKAELIEDAVERLYAAQNADDASNTFSDNIEINEYRECGGIAFQDVTQKDSENINLGGQEKQKEPIPSADNINLETLSIEELSAEESGDKTEGSIETESDLVDCTGINQSDEQKIAPVVEGDEQTNEEKIGNDSGNDVDFDYSEMEDGIIDNLDKALKNEQEDYIVDLDDGYYCITHNYSEPCRDVYESIPYISDKFSAFIIDIDMESESIYDFLRDSERAEIIPVEYAHKGNRYGFLFWAYKRFYFIENVLLSTKILISFFEDSKANRFVSLNPIWMYMGLRKAGIKYRPIVSFAAVYKMAYELDALPSPARMFDYYVVNPEDRGRTLSMKEKDVLWIGMPRYSEIYQRIWNDFLAGYNKQLSKFEWAISKSSNLSLFMSSGNVNHLFGGNALDVRISLSRKELMDSICKEGVFFSISARMGKNTLNDLDFWRDVAGTIGMHDSTKSYAYIIGVSDSGLSYYVCDFQEIFFDRVMSVIRQTQGRYEKKQKEKLICEEANKNEQSDKTELLNIQVQMTKFKFTGAKNANN
jgi:hypothetical protein